MKTHLPRIFLMLAFSVLAAGISFSQTRDIYQLKIYSIENEQQEQQVNHFLKDAYIPALHRTGIKNVGVFSPVEEEEMAGKLIYVLIPFESIGQFEQLGALLNKDGEFLKKGSDYINAAFDHPPYLRMESILLRAFSTMPRYGIPTHATTESEQIYELRSYQGATEKLFRNKVEMFNEGGETKIFMELGFQPVFFGEVISGSAMPNLMYLTTFKDKASQEEHWKAFQNSSDWEKLKTDERYQNNVSKIDKILLHPADYSEL
ncbi:MAG: NIPSNAP family protein [Bacteroidales bacterium]